MLLGQQFEGQLERDVAGAAVMWNKDATGNLLAASLFGFALGVVGVAVPLLALSAGYSGVDVGILVAISAVCQMGARLFVGALMRVLPDKGLVLIAMIGMALSCGIVGLSTVWPVFIASQVLQGFARALFWAGAQTHAIQTSSSSVAALARLNLGSGIGQVCGPLVAGALSTFSPSWAMMAGALASAMGIVGAIGLERLPPFGPKPTGSAGGWVWRRPGAHIACWGAASAGAWRGLVSSYVPVVLEYARQSAGSIGILISIANGAQIVGSALAGRFRRSHISRALLIGMVVTGLGVAAVGMFAGSLAVAAGLLLVSGVGAGVLQTISPAAASDAVTKDERGDAIASAGTFRAAALLLSPFLVAGLITVAPLSAALFAAGVVTSLPAAGFLIGARRRGFST